MTPISRHVWGHSQPNPLPQAKRSLILSAGSSVRILTGCGAYFQKKLQGLLGYMIGVALVPPDVHPFER